MWHSDMTFAIYYNQTALLHFKHFLRTQYIKIDWKTKILDWEMRTANLQKTQAIGVDHECGPACGCHQTKFPVTGIATGITLWLYDAEMLGCLHIQLSLHRKKHRLDLRDQRKSSLLFHKLWFSSKVTLGMPNVGSQDSHICIQNTCIHKPITRAYLSLYVITNFNNFLVVLLELYEDHIKENWVQIVTSPRRCLLTTFPEPLSKFRCFNIHW